MYDYHFFPDQPSEPLASQPLVTQSTLQPTISSQQISDVTTTTTNSNTTSEAGADELTFAIAAIDSTTATRPISVLEQHWSDESPNNQNDLKNQDINDQRSVSVLDKYLTNNTAINNNDFDRPVSVLEYRHPELSTIGTPEEALENITEVDDNISIVTTTRCETPVTYELETSNVGPQIILPVIDMNTRPGSTVNIEPDHPAIPTTDVMQDLLVSFHEKKKSHF